MSKIDKLLRDPKLFFTDMLVKRFQSTRSKSVASYLDENRTVTTQNDSAVLITTLVFGFSPWKSFLKDWFPNRRLVFLSRDPNAAELNSAVEKMKADTTIEIFSWGMKLDPKIISAAKRFGNKVNYIEDGFIRSVNLGATKTPPMSLTLDTKAPYFSSRVSTDLEDILNDYNFDEDPKLIERAVRIKEKLLEFGVSKYNNAPNVNMEDIYGPKLKTRILVVGQVEGDASILFGSAKRFTNNDLVMIAALENPDAQIIYKPHPDVLAKHRPEVSDPKELEHIAQILSLPVSLADSFHGVDHVYTITSLAGFEAILRGIKVTCLGAPFYSGWGITDDRQPTPSRKRNLSVDEILAASYILYPLYLDPIKRERIEVEEAIDLLIKLRAMSEIKATREIFSVETPSAAEETEHRFETSLLSSIILNGMQRIIDEISTLERVGNQEKEINNGN
jgi:capsular polysaccharide export protein